jgi:streptomycin 6-kinase
MEAFVIPWLLHWQLVPDGPVQVRESGVVQPVRTADGQAAVLKIMHDAQERMGAQLLQAWQGGGAARVLALADDALLMERLPGPAALALAKSGDAMAAVQAVCDCAAELHAHAPLPLAAQLPSVAQWLQALESYPASFGTQLARQLLAQPDATQVLHGDLHQDNVLRAADGTWKAIDPKGVVGERSFELALLLCNPEQSWADSAALLAAAAHIANASAFDLQRLLQWAAVRAALSAAWFAEDGATQRVHAQQVLAQRILSELLQK